MVVVAPMGTKPLLGGNFNDVPAGTRSGFLIPLISTKAGALRLKRCAMLNNDSPDCTTYVRNAPVATVVVVFATDVVVVEFDVDPPLPPSVRRPEMMARNAKTQVLHNRYMWRRVRKNIDAMLCQPSTW